MFMYLCWLVHPLLNPTDCQDICYSNMIIRDLVRLLLKQYLDTSSIASFVNRPYFASFKLSP